MEINGRKILGAIDFKDYGGISNALGIGAGLSALFPGVGTVISGILGLSSGITKSLAQNQQVQKEESRYNEALGYQKNLNDQAYQLALQNLGLQQDAYEYEKGLQQEIFAREDNAVQRRALDLEKAGLSKTLAAGSAANAGSAVNVSAPQMNYNPNEIGVFSALMDAYNQSRQTSSLMALQEAQSNLAYAEARKVNSEANISEQTGMVKALADIDFTLADTNLTKKQIESVETQIKNYVSQSRLNNANVERIYTELGLTPLQAKKLTAETNLLVQQNRYYSSMSSKTKLELQGIILNYVKTMSEIKSTNISNEVKEYDLNYMRQQGLPVNSSLPTSSFSFNALGSGVSYTGPYLPNQEALQNSLNSFVNKVTSMSPSEIDEAYYEGLPTMTVGEPASSVLLKNLFKKNNKSNGARSW